MRCGAGTSDRLVGRTSVFRHPLHRSIRTRQPQLTAYNSRYIETLPLWHQELRCGVRYVSNTLHTRTAGDESYKQYSPNATRVFKRSQFGSVLQTAIATLYMVRVLRLSRVARLVLNTGARTSTLLAQPRRRVATCQLILNRSDKCPSSSHEKLAPTAQHPPRFGE